MGKTIQLHGIVLCTHNVGEADRFAIILTKEQGKLPIRAYGVRKLSSRKGGSFLPLQEVNILARESSSGLQVVSSSLAQSSMETLGLNSFLLGTQCANILLSMLEDNHPVPEIFSLTKKYLNSCREGEVSSLLPFSIQLLNILGLLPTQTDHAIYAHLSSEEILYTQNILVRGEMCSSIPKQEAMGISYLCDKIISENGSRNIASANLTKEICSKLCN
ncbi:DNA repair protein RecO [Candidatus Peregrinibacteria bacterium]|jgi:DNA repair protein RecO (recombination protein O)|nr:DNA repair protein RecO [Candidatus Peregrinibacteria bacterium]MBT3598714.1 DNA repair protein RecO [Candidatus Peregrinibacteria bacterium]MBT4585375.1 DNA repair protein RecO [Candidatus Peregrinibacteria bacterium]MBT6731276.1 DNA repair protein RecO [Candidatus Peregrinibacteria bacterium]MBT7008854.1 DNA repair protein RecO [Candidatus Peregrinibacteria bacterium]